MDYFLYQGNKTSQISFPLGGIGTGCISLAGNGRLIDWEIFNHPSKGSVNGFSHFAIKAENDSKVLDARVLHGDLHAPYNGDLQAGMFQSFGFGPRREYLTGMPHFESVDFRGEFPLAELDFIGSNFPGRVKLLAFNPLIPLNDKDSGIPAAFFEFELTNTSSETLHYSLCGVLANPLPKDKQNFLEHQNNCHFLTFGSSSIPSTDTAYGDLTLATDAKDVSYQQHWFRGAWFDSLEVYWRDMMTLGKFKNRVYEQTGNEKGTAYQGVNEGLLAAHVTLAPNASTKVRFVISWNFPNCENTWNEKARAAAEINHIPQTWKNYYTTQWENSKASASYALENWDRLYNETRLFKDTLFASSLPPSALDAVSANISILKSPTVLRLEDGTFYGWEGCHPNVGCCEGSCTHVWNYAQALPFLFPKLERSMREADFRYNLRSDGGMAFRLQLPLGSYISPFRPCADGQFGGVMKTYRDWKICGDDTWLKSLWPKVKASLEFAWSPENEDRWDPDKTGVLWGRQHHTLDMELFGPNAWLTGFYLGAVKAAAEMAEHLGEKESAAEYRTIFERGKTWTDEHLFNGEYYIQQIDLKDKALLERFDTTPDLHGNTVLDAYWNDEHQEIKYQIKDGSMIDQLLAQWHANLYGLGDLFDPVQTKIAIANVYKYNFKTSSRDTYNPCRIYSVNDEAGLVICVWPNGTYQPMIPLPYAQETMHGYEYAAACLMLQNGLLDEGMTVVKSVRERYDGEKRNPWNELECGSNYARSMASYALLNAFSGFEFDMVQKTLGFKPIRLERDFHSLWSLDAAWGEVEITQNTINLQVHGGELSLKTLKLPFVGKGITAVLLNGEKITFEWKQGVLQFAGEVLIRQYQPLKVAIAI
jgi:non-lysosomal glucosylceramidase